MRTDRRCRSPRTRELWGCSFKILSVSLLTKIDSRHQAVVTNRARRKRVLALHLSSSPSLTEATHRQKDDAGHLALVIPNVFQLDTIRLTFCLTKCDGHHRFGSCFGPAERQEPGSPVCEPQRLHDARSAPNILGTNAFHDRIGPSITENTVEHRWPSAP